MSTKRRVKTPRRTPRLVKTFATITLNTKGLYDVRITTAAGELIAVRTGYSRRSSAIRGAKRESKQAVIRETAA